MAEQQPFDVRRAIEQSSSKSTLQELAKKGIHRVKVLDESMINKLIGDAVERIISTKTNLLSGEDREKLIKASAAPQSEEEAIAEVQRMQNLEYIDPNSPEGKAQQEKFEEEFRKTEADYKANVLPKATPSPISVGSAGVPRPPTSSSAHKKNCA